jgi:hypothetical protein
MDAIVQGQPVPRNLANVGRGRLPRRPRAPSFTLTATLFLTLGAALLVQLSASTALPSRVFPSQAQRALIQHYELRITITLHRRDSASTLLARGLSICSERLALCNLLLGLLR